MREKVAMYSFTVHGKTHLIADALSRAPLFSPQEHPELEVDTAIICLVATSRPSLGLIYSSFDDDYRTLMKNVLNATSSSSYSCSLKSDLYS